MKKAFRLALMVGVMVLMGYAQASHISVTGPPSQLHLAVGTLGATVDTVGFVVPSGSEGSGVPIAGSQTLLIEVATRRGGFSFALTMLVADSTNPLTNGGFTIPMTEISWTAAGGVIPSNTFNGTNNQLLMFFFATNGINRREDTHTFSYANTTTPVGGTYTSTVTYTAIIL